VRLAFRDFRWSRFHSQAEQTILKVFGIQPQSARMPNQVLVGHVLYQRRVFERLTTFGDVPGV
jgi:hypothetical protein